MMCFSVVDCMKLYSKSRFHSTASHCYDLQNFVWLFAAILVRLTQLNTDVVLEGIQPSDVELEYC